MYERGLLLKMMNSYIGNGTSNNTMLIDEDTLIRDRKRMMEDHTARKIQDVEEERNLKAYMAESNPENLLEGNDPGSVCMCKKELVANSGPGYTHFACCEDFPGQCKWRMNQEPVKDCMFRAQTRAKVSGHSLLISSCTRIEAQEEASRIFDENRLLVR